MIHIEGPWFKDEHGRTLLLRGVNLGGSSKCPYPNGGSHNRTGFYNHRDVSFVGRPFPLAEADEHFRRLKAWGLTFLRLVVTWEAIEHAGPSHYDDEYLDYIAAIVDRAGAHGFKLFIDPHQDCWGRLSGGDGAPGWTYEAVGLEPLHFSVTGAAIVHAIHGDPFPRMIWPTNYDKLAAATLFTLFFGGNDFAPQTLIDGEPAQEYLQRHYIGAIARLAQRLKGLPAVVGYDTFNEPSAGWIGVPDVRRLHAQLRLGEMPTPYQAMLLGAGWAQSVDVWEMALTGPRVVDARLVNRDRVSAWKPGVDPIWQRHGVWEVAFGAPRVLKPDYFAQVNGRPVDFTADYMRPFLRRYVQAIHDADPNAIVFLEGEGGKPLPWDPAADGGKVVNAAHWYDGLTLIRKDFRTLFTYDQDRRKLVWLPWRVRNSFIEQVARIRQAADEQMGGIPTLIGEFGIPFDMRKGKSFRTGDFSRQTRAMDASWRPMEANLVSCTLWNYTADNDNERGDRWNGEDLSIFSRSQQSNPRDINSGGRALEAVVRPYARATAGTPQMMHYDMHTRTFEFEFRHDPRVDAPTEVLLPAVPYPRGFDVQLSDGTFTWDEGEQVLRWVHDAERPVHRMRVTPRG